MPVASALRLSKPNGAGAELTVVSRLVEADGAPPPNTDATLFNWTPSANSPETATITDMYNVSPGGTGISSVHVTVEPLAPHSNSTGCSSWVAYAPVGALNPGPMSAPWTSVTVRPTGN